MLLLRPYVESSRFSITTVHEWLMTMCNVSWKLVRWLLRLTEFNFDIVHGVCIKPQAADALSRLSTDCTDLTEVEDTVPILILARENFPKRRKRLQQNENKNETKRTNN